MPTRIILTAGKGGVGKSTLAAATAALCASQGRRALVMSIDSAHNLGDLFGVPVGAAITSIAPGLSALEVDINRELQDNWHAVIDFFRTMTANNPRVTEVVAEECAILPGMEEVFGLMRLQGVVETGEWDVVVLDAPPTGDLLKFLRLPDVLQWVMGRHSVLDRGVMNLARPIADAMHWPMPTEEVLAEMEQWYVRVRQASATLMDTRHVSVRLVTTPERVGLNETKRAFTWTALLGMNVDAVVLNKVLPEEHGAPFLQPWLERQRHILDQAQSAFSAVPVLQAQLQPDEVLGVEALTRFGGEVYGERDPAALWSGEPPLRWSEEKGKAELRLRLPFLKKDSFRLLSGREGLVLQIENQRRIIPLPLAIRRRPMRGARYVEGWLHIAYGPPED